MIFFISGQQKIFESNDIVQCSVEDSLRYLNNLNVIGVDTETTGFDPYINKILSLQLGNKEHQFVIDATTIDIQAYKKLLENRDKLFIFQNAKFDLRFLYHHRIVVNNIYDTYLAEAVLYTGIKSARKGLDFLANKYCNVTLDKTIRGKIHKEGLSDRVIIYAAEDVEYLEDIMNSQNKELDAKDLQIALRLDNLFVKVLAYIEYSGIYLDRDKWKAKMVKDKERFLEAKKSLDKWILDSNLYKYIESQLDLFSTERSCTINWASQKQVIPLFKELGINTETLDSVTGKIKNSVDASILVPQKDKSPILPIYLEYKRAEKVISTYGDSFLKQINFKTNRIHSSFTQIMDTGRLSCGGKNKGTGEEYINLQNIPSDSETRSCFTAMPGNKLINADYSGQEQIVFANWSMDKDLLDFYDRDLGDMHSFIASKIFRELNELSLDEIKTKHKSKRQIAKAAGFAINYGGNGSTIATNLGLPEHEGDSIYKAYFDAFPGINSYFDKCKKQVIKDGFVLFNNITRRKSYVDFYEEYKTQENSINSEFWEQYRSHKERNTKEFYNYYKPKIREYFKMKGTMERKSLNYPIQGSSAEITKLACVKIFDYLQNNNLLFNVLFSNVVHDEVMLECSEELATEIAKVTGKCMEEAGAVWCKRVPLKADPCIVDYWSH